MNKFFLNIVKYIWHRLYLFVFLTLVIIVIVYFASKWEKKSEEYFTFTTNLWSISNSIKAVWTIQLVDEQQLRFNQLGTIYSVNIQEWQKVQKWDLLASLDYVDINNKIKQAQISLENAQLNLQETLNWWNQASILQSEQKVKSIENTITNSKKDLDLLIQESEDAIQKAELNITIQNKELESAQSWLVVAEEELETYIKSQNKSLSDTSVQTNQNYTTISNNIKKYLNQIDEIMNKTDKLFGITDANRSHNDSYEIYLWAKNTSLVNGVQNKFYQIEKNIWQINSKYEIFLTNNDVNTLYEVSKDMQSLAQNMIDLHTNAIDSVNASVSSTSYSDSQIKTDETNMISNRSQSQNILDSVTKDILTLQTSTDLNIIESNTQTTIANKQQSINDKKIALENATNQLNFAKMDLERIKKNYENKISAKKSEIQINQNNLQIEKINLELTNQWNSIQIAKNNVENQKINLENTKKSIENYELRAPFDGIVRKVDFQIWDKLTNDEAKYIYIENPDLVEIVMYLDQIDIVDIKLWQEAEIVLDAYPDQTLTWKITLVDSSPTTQSSVVSYQVKVSFDKQDLQIFQWMTSKVTIITKNKSDIVTVPTVYIGSDSGYSLVKLLGSDNQIIDTPVELGITNNIMTEIISWISVWDIIVRKKPENNTKSSTSNTNMRMPWVWWWGSSAWSFRSRD